ncbi:helix-turn-helix transcriptional regulator, partial [Pseudomonas aeruginosa]|nr:helix-turn-helix transcriptional regulator [Pseudomonas aeruginosa]
WETGSSYPTAPSLQKICEFFGVSESWLLEKPIKSGFLRPSFFRSQVTTPKISWDVADARLDWLEEISYKLQESLEFPPVNIPAYSGSNVREISDEDIEALADECRKTWRLGDGPIQNVIQVLENFGAVTAR